MGIDINSKGEIAIVRDNFVMIYDYKEKENVVSFKKRLNSFSDVRENIKYLDDENVLIWGGLAEPVDGIELLSLKNNCIKWTKFIDQPYDIIAIYNKDGKNIIGISDGEVCYLIDSNNGDTIKERKGEYERILGFIDDYCVIECNNKIIFTDTNLEEKYSIKLIGDYRYHKVWLNKNHLMLLNSDIEKNKELPFIIDYKKINIKDMLYYKIVTSDKYLLYITDEENMVIIIDIKNNCIKQSYIFDYLINDITTYGDKMIIEFSEKLVIQDITGKEKTLEIDL